MTNPRDPIQPSTFNIHNSPARAHGSVPRAGQAFSRYVAIGDSTVEGLDDPDGHGGYRGWANRLAEKLAAIQGGVLYANLGIRGRTTRQIREEQLGPALAMKPDLAIVVSGTNDLLRPSFDATALREDMEAMQRAFVDIGATVLTFTLPDLTPVMPLARIFRGRLLKMNDAVREAALRSGALVCDFARYPVASDPRLWSDDRLHANSVGHARMAEALASTLGLPGTNEEWSKPLDGSPPSGFAAFVGAEIAWGRKHFMPWVWRHLRGRSSGDGVRAKLPELTKIA
jgi:lysophospholipase L1-like esterase